MNGNQNIILLIMCMGLWGLHTSCARSTDSPSLPEQPTTVPAYIVSPTYNEATELASRILQPLSRYSPWDETVNNRYTLVRYVRGFRDYAPDGRPRFVARVTVDSWTGELIELRGDYEDNEIEKIERYRPRDIITPEEAIAIAENIMRFSGFKNEPPRVNRADIDLVARRYYIIRFPNAPQSPNSLAPYYIRRIVLDGKTKKAMDHRIG